MARSGHNFVLQNVLSWLQGGEYFIHHNLENIDPKDLVENHLKHPGYKLIIWRDFDDWLASSLMKAYKVRATRVMTDVPIYIDRICTTYWAIRDEARDKVRYKHWIVIHYDEFFKSREYRKQICEELKGEYSERDIDHVPANGHHSSFDGKNFQGKGSQMNVLNRSKDILNTPYKEVYLKSMEQYGKRKF